MSKLCLFGPREYVSHLITRGFPKTSEDADKIPGLRAPTQGKTPMTPIFRYTEALRRFLAKHRRDIWIMVSEDVGEEVFEPGGELRQADTLKPTTDFPFHGCTFPFQPLGGLHWTVRQIDQEEHTSPDF